VGDAAGRGRLRLDLDRDRIAEHPPGQLHDGLRQRGRKQHGLALDGQAAQDPPDVGNESHVQHAVRLVQNQALQPIHLRVAVLQVVQQATWRGHQHVHAGAQRLLLRTGGHAAVHGGAPQAGAGGQDAEVIEDLHGEFPRGRQDEGARAAGLPDGQAVQNGQEEGSGLAAAGDGGGHQVASREQNRDRPVLDWSGPGEAHLLHGVQQGRGQTQAVEGHFRSSRRIVGPLGLGGHRASRRCILCDGGALGN